MLISKAYQLFVINTLPEDIWMVIAQYLEPEELKTLRLTCKPLLQLVGSSDMLWQPLLNRLHAIDETISVLPDKGKSIRDTFIRGFETVKSRQQTEISDLLAEDNETKLSCHHIVEHDKSVTLGTLEKTSAQLDSYHCDIIADCIKLEIENNTHRLELPWVGITRLPVALFTMPQYASFWQTLTSLNLNDNYLQILPAWIGKLSSLEKLNVAENKIQALPSALKNLIHLQELHVDNNELAFIANWIGQLSKLKKINCSNNCLLVLPESIVFLPELQLLSCYGNDHLVIPRSITHQPGLMLIKDLHEYYSITMHCLDSVPPEMRFDDSLPSSGDMDIQIASTSGECSDEKSEEEDDLSSSDSFKRRLGM